MLVSSTRCFWLGGCVGGCFRAPEAPCPAGCAPPVASPEGCTPRLSSHTQGSGGMTRHGGRGRRLSYTLTATDTDVCRLSPQLPRRLRPPPVGSLQRLCRAHTPCSWRALLDALRRGARRGSPLGSPQRAGKGSFGPCAAVVGARPCAPPLAFSAPVQRTGQRPRTAYGCTPRGRTDGAVQPARMRQCCHLRRAE
jgi:hypothetical protein